nr:unnamed protein product [Spirometra erinaceieuropaei]
MATRLRRPDGPPTRHLRDDTPSTTPQEATRLTVASDANLTVEITSYSPPPHSPDWLDNPMSNRPERRTALVARELARNNVDIAELGETRFSEQGQLEEVGAGYTFLWGGCPRAERRHVGVAFAIQNAIFVAVGQKSGYLLCEPEGVDWNAEVRARPCHPPASSPISGLLDSVWTPGPDFLAPQRDGLRYLSTVPGHNRDHQLLSTQTGSHSVTLGDHLEAAVEALLLTEVAI